MTGEPDFTAAAPEAALQGGSKCRRGRKTQGEAPGQRIWAHRSKATVEASVVDNATALSACLHTIFIDVKIQLSTINF